MRYLLVGALLITSLTASAVEKAEPEFTTNAIEYVQKVAGPNEVKNEGPFHKAWSCVYQNVIINGLNKVFAKVVEETFTAAISAAKGQSVMARQVLEAIEQEDPTFFEDLILADMPEEVPAIVTCQAEIEAATAVHGAGHVNLMILLALEDGQNAVMFMNPGIE